MRKSILYIMLVVLLFSMTTCFSVYAAQSDDASDFVLLSEVIPDAILEVRYYSTYNFVGDRIEGYEEPLALLTREAAVALREVSDELMEKGYRLKIYDAYRPQCAVDHFVKWARDASDTRMKPYFYPELDKSVLFEQSYISSKSGHSRGSTVDLTLFDMSSGKEVDMGGTFDYLATALTRITPVSLLSSTPIACFCVARWSRMGSNRCPQNGGILHSNRSRIQIPISPFQSDRIFCHIQVNKHKPHPLRRPKYSFSLE